MEGIDGPDVSRCVNLVHKQHESWREHLWVLPEGATRREQVVNLVWPEQEDSSEQQRSDRGWVGFGERQRQCASPGASEDQPPLLNVQRFPEIF